MRFLKAASLIDVSNVTFEGQLNVVNPKSTKIILECALKHTSRFGEEAYYGLSFKLRHVVFSCMTFLEWVYIRIRVQETRVLEQSLMDFILELKIGAKFKN